MPRVPSTFSLLANDAPGFVAFQAPNFGAGVPRTPQLSGQVDTRPGLSLLGQTLDRQQRQRTQRTRQREEAARLEDALQDEVNDARTREADNDASEAVYQTLNGVNGYFGLLGKAAVDGRQDALDRIDNALRTIGERLDHPTQQQVWGERRAERFLDARQRIDAHFVQQSRAYNLSQTESRIGTHGRDAVNARFDSQLTAKAQLDRFGELKAKMIGEVVSLGQQKGDPPEAVQAAILNATTDLHTAVFDRLLSQEGGRAADAYLQRNADEINPIQKTAMQGRMEVTKRQDFALGAAIELDRILLAQREQRVRRLPANADIGPVAPMASEQILAYRAGYVLDAQAALDDQFAEGQIDARERELILSEIVRRDARRREQQATEELQAERTAQQMLIDSPLMAVDDLASTNPEIYNVLARGGRVGKLKGWANSGNRYETNMAWRAQLDRIDPSTLRVADGGMSKAEFRSFWIDKLNPTDLRYAEALYDEANEVKDPKVDDVLGPKRRRELEAAELGIITLGQRRSIRQEEAFAAYEKKVETLFQTYQRQVLKNQRALRPDEEQMLLDHAQKDEVLIGWGTRKSTYAITPAEREGAYVNVDVGAGPEEIMIASVDKDVRSEIVQRLYDNNRMPTEETIITLWARLGRPRNVRELFQAEEAEGSIGGDAIAPPPVRDPNARVGMTRAIGGSISQPGTPISLDVSQFVGGFDPTSATAPTEEERRQMQAETQEVLKFLREQNALHPNRRR